MRSTLENPFRVAVVIPAFNEGPRIGAIVRELSSIACVCRVIVGNNRSTDNTRAEAIEAGAVVVDEHKKGYGSACLAGLKEITWLDASDKPQAVDAVLFVNADGAEKLSEANMLIQALRDFDLVVGSRTLGCAQAGAVLPQQILGNGLACVLIRWFWGHHFTDLGPFRIIRTTLLSKIDMQDPDFGWIIEMQIKAIQSGARILELPVTTYCSEEPSKISGTFWGAISASKKIMFAILYHGFLGELSWLSRLWKSGFERKVASKN